MPVVIHRQQNYQAPVIQVVSTKKREMKIFYYLIFGYLVEEAMAGLVSTHQPTGRLIPVYPGTAKRWQVAASSQAHITGKVKTYCKCQ